MAILNFISFYNTLEEALTIRTSPSISFHEIRGIQLLPNNPFPYIQTTNTPNGIELEDWTVYVVDSCTGKEVDITNEFSVDRIFADDNGYNQFEWSITNVSTDFGNNLVYLKAEQAIGETFYSNLFQFTSLESNKTVRLDYKESESDNMQSIQVQMYFWQPLKKTELSTYYETSTRNTVTNLVKSQKFERWIIEFISNDLMIKIDDAFESKFVYLDLVRAYLFEANDIKEHSSEANFEENILKISFNKSDVYDPSIDEVIVQPTPPEIILNSVVANGVSAIFNFTYNNFTPSSFTFQGSQDQSTWNGINLGVTSPQSVPFNNTGIWYFRIIHPEAESNIITLDLTSDVIANNDNFQVIKGGLIDIDVLFNDTLVGETLITNVSNPSNGTATIIDNGTKIRYDHNDSVSSFDSFTYTISNGISNDTATVSIIVRSISIPAKSFLTSTDGFLQQLQACSIILDETRYYNGVNDIPVAGDFIYEDAALSFPFNGNNKWYAVKDGKTISISPQGEVIEVLTCY